MKNPREKALFILDSILYKGAFLEEEIEILRRNKNYLENFTLIREIVTGVIRNKKYIDYVIKKKSNIKFNKIHNMILTILEMGVYQLYFLDKVPKYSVVNESVNLAKIYGNRGSASFVNGILRNLSREEKIKVRIEDEVENLSIFYSHPEFYTKYFFENYGVDFTKKLLKSNNEIAPFFIRVNTLKISASDLKVSLEKKGYEIKDTFLKNSFEIVNPENIFNTEEFNEGYFYVQDLASIFVGEVLNPKKETKVLDLCAAPGGKSTHLSAIMENTGKIISCDKTKKKLKLIEENKERLGIKNIETYENDARVLNRNFLNKFQYVLLDAPCSATGLYRKKTDIKLNRNYEDIIELSKLQLEILNNAAKYVKDNGVLVYSTCSVTQEENEEVIKNFLDSDFGKNFKVEKIKYRDNSEDVLKLFPHIDGTDGFSIVKLIKL